MYLLRFGLGVVSLVGFLLHGGCCFQFPVVSVGDAQVELAVEGPSAFRVSVSYRGKPEQTASRMINVNGKAPAFEAHHLEWEAVPAVLLNTTFGSMQLSTKGRFELRDSSGNVLVASAQLASHDQKQLSVFLGLGDLFRGQGRNYFAAGFKPGAPLTANFSDPSIGNIYGGGSWSWAPQYYSPLDTYGALAVGTQDVPDTKPGSERCVGDTTGRQDCGYYGINQSGCLAKNCCWGPNTEDLPWCYEKTSASLSSYPASWVSSSGGVNWTIQGLAVDIYLMPAHSPKAFRKVHADLTGAPVLIPRYAFGFMAGRWGWKDRADIEENLGKFRSGSFPIDAFISDFEWFTTANDYGLPPAGSADYTDFGYTPTLFPDPRAQLAKYHSMGFKFAGIRKPRLGNTELLNTARSNAWLVPGGVDGKDRNMNFSIKAARDWYQQHNQHYLQDGVDFWWNDEGEVYYFMFDDWNDALASGFAKNDSSRRYFSLNRVYTPGMQRQGGAMWTGDVAVSWEALAQQPLALLNAQMMGMPYVGCDTGGFKGDDASPELLTRWYQLSAFMTIMRVHSHEKNTPHFPYLYGDEAADAMRKALELRYHMIPALYSLAHDAFTDGAPIARPLFMEYPADATAASITDQWLIGSSLLAAPIMAPGGSRSVYLPGTTRWFEFNTSNSHMGGSTLRISNASLDFIPAYCPAGSVLPLAPKIQSTGSIGSVGGALEMHVYSGADGAFSLVEDDGETNLYKTGVIRRTVFTWSDANKTLTWHVDNAAFTGPSVFTEVKVTLFAPGSQESSARTELKTEGSIPFGHRDLVV
jgi:alpha-glucosidase